MALASGVSPTLREGCPKGGQASRWSIWVDEKWRLTFAFEGTDVVLLDYEDYH